MDGGNSLVGIGTNDTINFGNNTGSGSETVVVIGDLTGATTSGGTSTSAIAMCTHLVTRIQARTVRGQHRRLGRPRRE